MLEHPPHYFMTYMPPSRHAVSNTNCVGGCSLITESKSFNRIFALKLLFSREYISTGTSGNLQPKGDDDAEAWSRPPRIKSHKSAPYLKVNSPSELEILLRVNRVERETRGGNNGNKILSPVEAE